MTEKKKMNTELNFLSFSLKKGEKVSPKKYAKVSKKRFSKTDPHTQFFFRGGGGERPFVQSEKRKLFFLLYFSGLCWRAFLSLFSRGGMGK